MQKATLLRPASALPRSAAEVARWLAHRAQWLAGIAPEHHFLRIFDHLPGVHFFAKDQDGHLMFASRDLLLRYQMRDETEFIGMTDYDINPWSMADSYVKDDQQILSGRVAIIKRIELWWDQQQMPDWYLVTKLPLLDNAGQPHGVMGTLRRPDENERSLPVFQTVARAVEIMRTEYGGELLVAEVARRCGQSLRQLQRHFQSAFGITPQEFLLKTRVLAAARMIDESSDSIAEIARRCGFVDASSFTQHFKLRTGWTPVQYRKRS